MSWFGPQYGRETKSAKITKKAKACNCSASSSRSGRPNAATRLQQSKKLCFFAAQAQCPFCLFCFPTPSTLQNSRLVTQQDISIFEGARLGRLHAQFFFNALKHC